MPSDQRTGIYFCSFISWTQQVTCGHVARLEHIVLILSKPNFALINAACVVGNKQILIYQPLVFTCYLFYM